MRPLRFLFIVQVIGIASAAGQSFNLQVTRDGSVFEISNGATIDLRPHAIGADATVSLTAVYTGTQRATILTTDLQGPNDFSVQGVGTPTLGPGGRYSLSVQYHASNSSFRQALLTVTYQEASQTPVIAVLRLGFTGSAPDFVLSYTLAADRSVRPVANGSAIGLPSTPPGATSQATLSITNVGTAPGVIRSVSISAVPFDLLDLPLLPATVAAGQSLTFAVRASPLAAGSYSGALHIEGPGPPFSCTVNVTSALVNLTYSLISAGGTSRILPGATISFPDTFLGETSQLDLQITNSTSSYLSIGAIALSGSSDFRLSAPLSLPLNLAPGDTRSLSVVFAPSRAQVLTSMLNVGGDMFPLSGTALASALGFWSTAAGGVEPVDPGGTITLGAAAIGTSQTADLIIRNQTAQTLVINQAGIAEAASPFHAAPSSPFPISLLPQQATRLRLEFTPVCVGALTSTLAVNSYVFAIRGVGLPPGKLPNIGLSGPRGPIGALRQAFIVVALQDPVPFDVTGMLSMSFDSASLAADPALQFSSGGRTVSFRIAEGDLIATFPNGGTRIGVQTGSVAGDIRLSATMKTTANFDLTPPIPPTLNLEVDQAEPSILAVGITGDSGAYQIQILGITTNRTLKRLNLQFALARPLSLSPGNVTLDIAAAAEAWFSGATSLQFGGLFSLTVPIQIAPPPGSATIALRDVLRAISVKTENSLGWSAPFTLDLQ